MQEGNYGQQFTLADRYQLDMNTLSEMAALLVKLHESCVQVATLAKGVQVKG